jgi:hypothetical protein|tara:strand:- start:181 stop:939 length:759 start_codon:yes stop_codon:yes gene_type:complete
MKKILKLTTIALLLIFSISCENDDSELNIESTIEQEKIVESNLKSKFFKTNCEVTGSKSACSGQTFTYTYTSDIQNPNITWNSSPAGAISLISQSGNSATFQFNSGFTIGFISAIGVGSETCSDTIKVVCGNGDVGNDTCACPAPIIDDRLCVSGGHPHWRFQVDGISSSDQITWSINHGTIHSNPNQSYVIIEPNSGSTYGFTVYCKVERTCPDGSKKVRTAFYTNYYGNSCGTGTTGFVGGCSGGIEIGM